MRRAAIAAVMALRGRLPVAVFSSMSSHASLFLALTYLAQGSFPPRPSPCNDRSCTEHVTQSAANFFFGNRHRAFYSTSPPGTSACFTCTFSNFNRVLTSGPSAF